MPGLWTRLRTLWCHWLYLCRKSDRIFLVVTWVIQVYSWYCCYLLVLIVVSESCCNTQRESTEILNCRRVCFYCSTQISVLNKERTPLLLYSHILCLWSLFTKRPRGLTQMFLKISLQWSSLCQDWGYKKVCLSIMDYLEHWIFVAKSLGINFCLCKDLAFVTVPFSLMLWWHYLWWHFCNILLALQFATTMTKKKIWPNF